MNQFYNGLEVLTGALKDMKVQTSKLKAFQKENSSGNWERTRAGAPNQLCFQVNHKIFKWSFIFHLIAIGKIFQWESPNQPSRQNILSGDPPTSKYTKGDVVTITI